MSLLAPDRVWGDGLGHGEAQTVFSTRQVEEMSDASHHLPLRTCHPSWPHPGFQMLMDALASAA
jgi:hypothetical protein